MSSFKDFLLLCELEDLGFVGNPYAYSNRKEGDWNVQASLDRACADEGWRDMFSVTRVIHLMLPYSDHCHFSMQLGGALI